VKESTETTMEFHINYNLTLRASLHCQVITSENNE